MTLPNPQSIQATGKYWNCSLRNATFREHDKYVILLTGAKKQASPGFDLPGRCPNGFGLHCHWNQRSISFFVQLTRTWSKQS
jgi:hypothetical protein